ncbi:hypothetical protein J5N97_002975 [Dioscorea zingiberensis]|uniref:Uncharacterized protein n=1 Tax=Dioscorea zingiberensis TaxID=325984 RepID=A0A9D5HPX6_9LILI|nr:hypothetical protein J5N97_002975 [Dioscorea zingiberensis]
MDAFSSASLARVCDNCRARRRPGFLFSSLWLYLLLQFINAIINRLTCRMTIKKQLPAVLKHSWREDLDGRRKVTILEEISRSCKPLPPLLCLSAHQQFLFIVFKLPI